MNDANNLIFDFSIDANISSWRIVDDIVMGGRSNGNFEINKSGSGVFFGFVSLENNGGFSSLRYRFKEKEVSSFKNVCIRLKGDGKPYQFRIKDKVNNKHSFISSFKTTGDWQIIVIPLSEMYPAFRGRKLAIGNFSSNKIEEVAFLIGNKLAQNFKLEIDKIYLQ